MDGGLRRDSTRTTSARVRGGRAGSICGVKLTGRQAPPPRPRVWLLSGALALVASAACTPSTSGGGTEATGGRGADSGGASGQGGGAGGSSSNTGGAPNTGGGAAATGGTGGSSNSGGSTATGGATATGGSSSNGGGGDATGGAGGSGGDAGSGSETSTPPPAGGCGEGATTKFCDDFENQSMGMPPSGDFAVEAKAGAMVVDGSKPYRGTKSLHIKVAAPGSRAMLDFTKQFPFNDFHGRAMVFMTKVNTNDEHWDFFYGQNSANVWELGGQFQGWSLVIDPPDHPVYSKDKIPLGRWMCIQWNWKFAGAGVDTSYTAKVDGKTFDKSSWTGADPSGRKWTAGPWKKFSAGFENYGSTNVDIDMWIDDLAFGEQEIPCPTAP
jgi:hypothetical protein